MLKLGHAVNRADSRRLITVFKNSMGVVYGQACCLSCLRRRVCIQAFDCLKLTCQSKGVERSVSTH